MKTLTPLIAEHINELGIEPVNILSVQWAENGNFLKYGDKSIEQEEFVDGVILQISNLESVIKLDSQGQSQGLSVTLDDTNSVIKDIMDVNDVHGCTVRLLQWFEGLPLSEAFQLYEGEITSPIQWSEGDRTISFSVITQLANKEVGFSPEEADISFLPDSMIGVAWPLVFGLVQNVPAVRLFESAQAQSVDDVGAIDESIGLHVTSLGIQYEALDEQLKLVRINELLASAGCTQGIQEACAEEEQLHALQESIVSTMNQIRDDSRNLRSIENEQEETLSDTIDITNGYAFPQGETITLQIGDIELIGVLTNNTFTIQERSNVNFTWEEGDDPFGYTFEPAGSTVTIKTDSPKMYIVSIVPVTVYSVRAYRRTENEDILVIVPPSWYEVKTADVNSYTVTYIEVSIPISSRDKSMQDDLYVVCESAIGPNTVDIIKWLIDTYTDLSYDITSFNYVERMLENYPSHFAMLERKNIFQTLEEIAFQARCAIWINNGVFYLKYLSEELVADDTITETDIDAGSLVLGTTQTEELVTKLIAEWTDDYALDEPHKTILRYKVSKYGTRERVIDFYIYNLSDLVTKSATFWLIRFANIWKIVTFDTYVSKLAIETFDTINLSLEQPHIANSDINCFITAAIYDTSTHLLNLTCWVPVRFGEMDQYSFAWPSQILPELEFPTSDDYAQEWAGGSGPGTDVDLEEGGLTIQGVIQTYGVQESYNDRRDYGEKTPSDINDVKPVPNFAGTNITTGPEPEYDYAYDSYAIEITEEEEEGSWVFPGVVVSYLGLGINVSIYEVDVFTGGIGEAPERLEVMQLQIDEDERIPTGTYVLVAKNLASRDEEDNIIPEYSLNNDGYEWTMQVPIWL